MKNALSEFWRTTWLAWQSGLLSSLSSEYENDADGNCEAFKNRVDLRSPLINEFFTLHTPESGEFLVGFGTFKGKAVVVVTNNHLWLYDEPGNEYAFDIASLSDVIVKQKWSSTDVIIQFNDGTEQIIEKLPLVPNKAYIRLAIELGNDAKKWNSERYLASQSGVESVALKCIKCHAPVDPGDATQDRFEWIVLRYNGVSKKRRINYCGLPMGGKARIHILQLKPKETFNTHVCTACVQHMESDTSKKIKEAKEIYEKERVELEERGKRTVTLGRRLLPLTLLALFAFIGADWWLAWEPIWLHLLIGASGLALILCLGAATGGFNSEILPFEEEKLSDRMENELEQAHAEAVMSRTIRNEGSKCVVLVDELVVQSLKPSQCYVMRKETFNREQFDGFAVFLVEGEMYQPGGSRPITLSMDDIRAPWLEMKQLIADGKHKASTAEKHDKMGLIQYWIEVNKGMFERL